MKRTIHHRTGTTLCISVAVWLAALVMNALAGDLVRFSEIVGYSDGPLGQAGNTEGWIGTSGNISVVSGSGSLDGTPLGLLGSRGDKAQINATEALNVYNLFAASGQFRPDVPRNLYFSFLYKFNNAADVSSAGERIIQVNRQNAGTQFTLQGFARENGGKLQVGVGKNGGTPVYAARQIDPGETVFLVFRQQIIPPAGAGDIVDVWVDPPTNSFSVDETITPPPDPDASASDGTEDTSNTGPGRFYLASGANAEFDELRIGTNWADVTPLFGLCNPAAITVEPVDAMVAEGIPATFRVGATGTAPLFQWQVSADGGQTWSNVSGGTGAAVATYTTGFPSLADNGKRYRSIVTVTCGGESSVTSAVATLTVNKAFPTAPGLVLQDNWTNDLSVNTGPVTTNNSVWFASSAGSLYLDPVNNDLVASPLAGSSTLWLGYYTDATNMPVDLQPGRTLKVTLNFRATGISETNGSLRIGLFDYADGGTRVSADGFGSGSAGNGQNVRGYMLGLYFSTVFYNNTPMTLYARKALDSGNLMGSTGDYQSLGNGPAGLDLLNAPAFSNDTDYRLEFSVTRTNDIGVLVSASVTGGGTNWTHTVGDTLYNYHRFDAIGIRPNTQETTATWFEIKQFKVEVLESSVPRPEPIPLILERSGDSLVLSWTNPAFQLQSTPDLSGTWTNVSGATSPHPVALGTGQQFFRLRAE